MCMPKFIDLTGRRFGRYTILRRVASRGPHSYWFCRCDCGIEREVRAQALTDGTTKSCGCHRAEIKRQECIDRTIHGQSRRAKKSRTYIAWSNMVQRCTNPRSDRFFAYGGRGITVCKRWLIFANFLEDMGECPSNLTLERKDVNGPYTKVNCCWDTQSAQANNKTVSRHIEHAGVRLTIAEWADRLGINRRTLHGRLFRLGWSIEDALTLPSSPIGRRLHQRVPCGTASISTPEMPVQVVSPAGTVTEARR